MGIKSFILGIVTGEKVSDSPKILQDKVDRLKEKNEELEQELVDLKQKIKKIDLTDEVNKAIGEIEIIKGILATELKRENSSGNTVLNEQLREFFSTSLYIYSKQLSKLTRALLILTVILIIIAVIQIIITLI